MGFIERHSLFIALVLLGWLLVGCICTEYLNGSVTPTPTPIPTIVPTPTATPGLLVPTPTSTPAKSCPSNCSDSNPCTADYCDSTTGYNCRHSNLDGDQPGCSGSAGACLKNTCNAGVCGTVNQTPCCGNGICESTEGCGSCTQDCSCPDGQLCCNNTCAAPLCSNNADCTGTTPCMKYTCANPNTCSAACTIQEKDCLASDGCCPAACDYTTDKDCPVYSLKQWATLPNGLKVYIDSFSRKTCIGLSGTSIQGQEKKYLRMKVNIKNDANTNLQLSSTQFSIIDNDLHETFTVSSPLNMDCYIVDGEKLIGSSVTYSAGTESEGVLYFYIGSINVPLTSKTILITNSTGTKTVFLATPA